MGAESIDFIVDFIQFASNVYDAWEQYDTYQEMVSTVEETWLGAADSGNIGQAVIAFDYCIPAGDEVIAEWADNWPNVDSGDYAIACYDSHEAAWDCWSETIETLVGMIETLREIAEDDDIDSSDFAEDPGEDGEEGEEGE